MPLPLPPEGPPLHRNILQAPPPSTYPEVKVDIIFQHLTQFLKWLIPVLIQGSLDGGTHVRSLLSLRTRDSLNFQIKKGLILGVVRGFEEWGVFLKRARHFAKKGSYFRNVHKRVIATLIIFEKICSRY